MSARIADVYGEMVAPVVNEVLDGRSNPPLATDNPLEDTDGVTPTPIGVFSRGGSLLLSIYRH